MPPQSGSDALLPPPFFVFVDSLRKHGQPAICLGDLFAYKREYGISWGARRLGCRTDRGDTITYFYTDTGGGMVMGGQQYYTAGHRLATRGDSLRESLTKLHGAARRCPPRKDYPYGVTYDLWEAGDYVIHLFVNQGDDSSRGTPYRAYVIVASEKGELVCSGPPSPPTHF